jgi:proteasome lid subunit RPN8/RPN11
MRGAVSIIRTMLKIRRTDFELIVRHAEREAPSEACGALLGKREGKEKIVERVVKSKNVLSSPTEYRISAEEILETFKLAELLELEVLGFYHSHPFHGAFWSAIDEERGKYWIGHSFLIYSLPAREARCYFRVSEKKVEEEPIVIL